MASDLPAASSAPSRGSVLFRLSIMMLLQYAVWGAWLPVAARYLSAPTSEGGLGFTAGMIGLILGLAGSIGAVCAPFIAGQVADRYFSAQRFLALLLVIGGGVKWYTAYQTSYTAWVWLSIAYSVVYMPTLALSNSIAFAHIRNQERDFPVVRVWGTVGWIAASWIFPIFFLLSSVKFSWLPPFYAGPEREHVTAHVVDALKFAGVISFVYAAFCLFLLPDTPPKRAGVEPLAFAKAFRLLRKPSFLVVFLISLPISVIHQIYFMQTAPFFSAIGLKDSLIGPAMTIGQFAEIGVMALLGLMLTRLGFKTVIFIGTFAYVLRYLVFGTIGLPPWVIVTSQALHGFCYACFFAGSFIYVDRITPKDVRHSAQTLYAIFILGLGPVLGGVLSGLLEQWFGAAGSPGKFVGIWYTQAGIALAAGLLFLLLFRSEVTANERP